MVPQRLVNGHERISSEEFRFSREALENLSVNGYNFEDATNSSRFINGARAIFDSERESGLVYQRHNFLNGRSHDFIYFAYGSKQDIGDLSRAAGTRVIPPGDKRIYLPGFLALGLTSLSGNPMAFAAAGFTLGTVAILDGVEVCIRSIRISSAAKLSDISSGREAIQRFNEIYS